MKVRKLKFKDKPSKQVYTLHTMPQALELAEIFQRQENLTVEVVEISIAADELADMEIGHVWSMIHGLITYRIKKVGI